MGLSSRVILITLFVYIFASVVVDLVPVASEDDNLQADNSTTIEQDTTMAETTITGGITTTKQDTPSPVTTAHPVTGAPVTPPVVVPSTNPATPSHFDAASFVGGIVLCGGLIAIAFFGYKFFKSRSDASYNQL